MATVLHAIGDENADVTHMGNPVWKCAFCLLVLTVDCTCKAGGWERAAIGLDEKKRHRLNAQ